jgi:hypothetical protein
MEPRFGYDFSQVRVRTDAKAAESARAINASAYTVGRDVVFGPGQSSLKNANGYRLLAHELTHVVQQIRPGSESSQLRVGASGTAPEQEAQAMSAPGAGARRVVERVPLQLQRDVDDPGRMAAIHQKLFVSAPGTSGGARRPWQDASGTNGGTAKEIIAQAKGAFQKLIKDNPLAVGGTIPTLTTESDLDADAVEVNHRIEKRFPQITTTVSDQQITDAVSVLSPTITSDPDYLHQWLANKLIGWTDIELYEISETDPRFVAMLDALLNDADIGAGLHKLAARQSGYQTGEGTSRKIAVHGGTSAAQRRLVLIHELIHFHAHPTYRAWVNGTTDPRFYSEGFTEWLAQRAMTTEEKSDRGIYKDRVDAINQQVAAHVSEDDIARAYFGGEVWRVESRSAIARREFAAASGIRAEAGAREESRESASGPGLVEEVAPGVRYRFFNLGNERPEPKPEHVAFFRTLKSQYLDTDPALGIRFEGHASTPGSLAYNERLSLQRAQAFYAMARGAGVPEAKLLNAQDPVHFGETRPTLAEENAETRAFNRRTELFLTYATQPTGNSPASTEKTKP